jgi:hypothetical protein
MLLGGSCLSLALWLGGCSTLSGDFHQKLQIDALDAQNRPVDGMRCQVGSGTSAKTVVIPATEVRVRRALAPIDIECQRDNLVAKATVKSRRERMEEALLPFGSVAVFVDHLSGTLYSYPTTIHLRVGQHVVLEHGAEAKVVTSEPIQPAPQPGSASVSAPRPDLAAVQPAASAPRTDLAAALPAANAATASTQRASATVHKSRAAPASKSDRTVSKPAKTARTVAATTKARTAPAKLAVTAPAAATAAAVVNSTPANW